MHHIKFGNIDFATEEMYVFSEGAYSAPSRDVSKESVLGRNGDIIVDNGRYNNTVARFTVHITEDVPRNIDRLKYLLYSQKGYQRLYDSSHKGFYRMACFTDGFDFSDAERGNVFLTFDCKPQKYSIAGDEWVDVPPEEVEIVDLVNPFFEKANPLIEIYGSGNTSGSISFSNSDNLTKDDYVINFQKPILGALQIDTEMQQARIVLAEGGEYYNGARYVDNLFVQLSPGTTAVKLSGGFSARIKPRWWTI